ncbi:hypothetical protein NDU88_000031 [Pleurodeles waltl]|uniref:Uncharacterized protein n=1 Tax=Pleurodeles waltl TaxID=8319 RepID=A0AAV7UQI7_PLEWA|nr:hypothetical protein NDU88_000031 [Pleurodeles waltl]
MRWGTWRPVEALTANSHRTRDADERRDLRPLTWKRRAESRSSPAVGSTRERITAAVEGPPCCDEEETSSVTHRDVCGRADPKSPLATAAVSGTDKTETSAPRSHVAIGTPSALLTRFPVSRETLKTFRDTEEGKTKVRGQPDKRVEGEKKDAQSAETVERSIEPIKEVAEGGATNDGRPELENPGASLGTGEFKLKNPLGKGNGKVGKAIREGAQV